MATKKESTESVEEKKPKASTAKKTTMARKPARKKEDPVEMKEASKEEKPEAEEITAKKVGEDETGAAYDPKILKPEEVEEKPKASKVPAIIDNTDEILKASDVELPPEAPAGKLKIVVSHDKASRTDNKVEVISAEEVLKDLEYDFDTHEIKPFKGEAMTSHDMHQGKYGIIEDVTKEKKKK